MFIPHLITKVPQLLIIQEYSYFVYIYIYTHSHTYASIIYFSLPTIYSAGKCYCIQKCELDKPACSSILLMASECGRDAAECRVHVINPPITIKHCLLYNPPHSSLYFQKNIIVVPVMILICSYFVDINILEFRK